MKSGFCAYAMRTSCYKSFSHSTSASISVMSAILASVVRPIFVESTAAITRSAPILSASAIGRLSMRAFPGCVLPWR